ncbi:serine/threonine protein kinase [Dolichospermum sp. LEGE 00240]|jgi:eukaryotic-like serine/threonine-protein kinase|uniref:serine/threonine-protein kinase n=1 Tax=Dolichospermum sp. LEGE 00240 TaxID=1828603 RepID=UPI00187DE24B|nr:serine/threonine-protein kinase [Dolichospermum sp. LEGE 00240]MDM3846826.1 serine/threonine-protein kinase [Aphanizomenon gracile PMC638.10]MDM3848415.1 serine/threonine-protein kinase [Aphanizomenon gracile PMC627.10]MDM3857760.1 serine/threonine-protein kinase [Aphanizomenon gracile PMC649.10]MDM3862181.1 serine/threonine-protein kinase [Aphanizomenon gracile PMC644.10]MBE9250841.1 serine/threonine protein kinase [Dolichospermum sp. LEGE 00240]
MSDPNIGRLLGNRYQLQELIGSGAMGRVYRAKDTLLGGVPVAVKFLTLSIQNERMRCQERFEREAKTCALLGQKSIHIVRVMDYGVDETYYVMEYLQGQTLGQIIRQKHLSLARFVSMSKQIGLGLQCAHNGIPVDGKICPIIHRDIKPGNIMVIQDPSFGELVKVLDFGIAKLLMSNSDHTKFYLGTLAYSSPEQIEGKELDSRSDIYSFGIMMFEMLTGKIPVVASTNTFGAWYKAHTFEKPCSFAEISPNLHLPKQLEDVIMNCLCKKPSERPQSINEIINILTTLEQQKETHNTTENAFIYQDTQDIIKPISPVVPEPVEKIKTNLLTIPVTSHNTQVELRRYSVHHDITQLVTWPHNKPIANIVFIQPIYHDKTLLPALWVMLPQEEIQKRLVCTRYNQFLFISSPHPVMLWITVIYSRQHGAKWLPYYLDLKTSSGQEITRLLYNTGQYRLLFFAKETPHPCTHILQSNIAAAQRERLQEWLVSSQGLTSSTDGQISKNLLKKEYEKIKPKILAKLETIDTDSSFDISG